MISKENNFGGASTKSDANANIVKRKKRYNFNLRKYLILIIGAANASIVKRKKRFTLN